MDVTHRRNHILMLTPFLPRPGRNAGQNWMFGRIKVLAERYGVILCSFYDYEEETEAFPLLAGYCLDVKANLRRPKLIPRVWDVIPEFILHFSMDEMGVAICETLETWPVDLLLVDYLYMAQYASLAPSIPKVLVKHEFLHQTFKRYQQYASNWSDRWHWFCESLKMLPYEVNIMNSFDRVVFVSTADEKALSRFLDRAVQTTTIALSVDSDSFCPGVVTPVTEPDSLIFVGGFRHAPNVDAMIFFCMEILPLIKKEVPGVKLYIIGSYPGPEILALQEAQEGVVVTGFVEDLRPYLCPGGIFVAPLRLGTGFRGKLLEALSMEMGIVTTSIGAAGYKNAGDYMLIADTPEDFARQVIRLLRNEALRTSLGEAGRQMILNRYGWSVAKYDWYTLLDECIDSKERMR